MLNRFAQNAILKILEEPPARAIILMVATTPGSLLPTIRSRCRILPLAPLDNAHIKTILTKLAPKVTEPDLVHIIGLAGGSVGFALKIIRTETLPLYDELLAILDAGSNLDMARLHKLADQISRKADTESFEVVTMLLLSHLREATRTAALSGEEKMLLDRRVQLWEKVRNIFAMAESANLDRKLAFINVVSEIYSQNSLFR
jgi:DNA polymerase-3 subunit delta'